MVAAGPRSAIRMSEHTLCEVWTVTRTEHAGSILALLPLLIGSSGTEFSMLNTVDADVTLL